MRGSYFKCIMDRSTASRLVLTLLSWACATAPRPTLSGAATESSPVRLTFRAQSDSFATARDAYETIWRAEGRRIVATMERVSGLRFDSPPYADTSIVAIVFEGVSNSGYRDDPMHLRASYPVDTKKATLVHELGHRLQVGVAHPGEDEHEVLFLWLYDTWAALWGREFADAQVLVERARRGPYTKAWDAALSLDSAARAARFGALRSR
jgi:hypothetical protein